PRRGKMEAHQTLHMRGTTPMSAKAITVEAIYEGGVFRPLHPCEIADAQRVKLTVQVADPADPWPPNTAAIYQEIADDERRLAAEMWPTVRETWPPEEESP